MGLSPCGSDRLAPSRQDEIPTFAFTFFLLPFSLASAIILPRETPWMKVRRSGSGFRITGRATERTVRLSPSQEELIADHSFSDSSLHFCGRSFTMAA
jgi:hypothetical protein